MNKIVKFELIIIYLLTLVFSYAIYIAFISFGADTDTASALLSWHAAIFATVALLCTIESWRNQKSSEILSRESEDVYKFLKRTRILLDDSYVDIPRSLSKTKDHHKILYKNLGDNIYDLELFMDILKKLKKEDVYNELNQYLSNYRHLLQKISFINNDLEENDFQEYLEYIGDSYVNLEQNYQFLMKNLINFILHHK